MSRFRRLGGTFIWWKTSQCLRTSKKQKWNISVRGRLLMTSVSSTSLAALASRRMASGEIQSCVISERPELDQFNKEVHLSRHIFTGRRIYLLRCDGVRPWIYRMLLHLSGTSSKEKNMFDNLLDGKGQL
ncbi:conserved hypothetical protein [Coccidioides posadasii str. Silveira]|uniref:Uncharacterized protein n=1 Tax=Coccidioides posadasii (strain RMSCC 757 / Silveira) TaxID=443226 RepID=E9DCV0_COCPS|nr:conserved hypothetical protein [Coccidioides posadasii str. Silveira]